MAEDLPEIDVYTASVLAEHAEVELDYIGSGDSDIVAGAEELLRRQAEPGWRRAASHIGSFLLECLEGLGRNYTVSTNSTYESVYSRRRSVSNEILVDSVGQQR